MTGQKLGFLVAIAVLLSTLALSCSQDPNACSPGKPCVCKGEAVCDKYCTGQGCDFTCSDIQGECKFKCEQGGCTVTAEEIQGTVVVECGGGNCDVNYRGQGKATLSCEGNGCKMKCSGQGECRLISCNKNCSLTCSITMAICNNDCEDDSCEFNRSGN